MRDYECHYYKKEGNKLIKNSNVACWAGLSEKQWRHALKENKINCSYPSEIYISKFKQKEINYADIKRVINIINLITPCRLVTIKGTIYIKYRLIIGTQNNYNVNLIILNFIRLFWSKDRNFCINNYYKLIKKVDKKTSTPLFNLMDCLKNSVKKGGKYYGDHSHVIPGIVPKTFTNLIQYYNSKNHNNDTSYFITEEY